MNHIAHLTIVSTLAVILSLPAWAQAVNDEPLVENWAPSEWGADDKAGSVNRTTPEMVLEAVGLVMQGKVATLGKVYTGTATFRNLTEFAMLIGTTRHQLVPSPSREKCIPRKCPNGLVPFLDTSSQFRTRLISTALGSAPAGRSA